MQKTQPFLKSNLNYSSFFFISSVHESYTQKLPFIFCKSADFNINVCLLICETNAEKN